MGLAVFEEMSDFKHVEFIITLALSFLPSRRPFPLGSEQSLKQMDWTRKIINKSSDFILLLCANAHPYVPFILITCKISLLYLRAEGTEHIDQGGYVIQIMSQTYH